MGKETFNLEQQAKEIKTFKIDKLPAEELAKVLKSIEGTLQAQKKIGQIIKDNPSKETLDTIVNR